MPVEETGRLWHDDALRFRHLTMPDDSPLHAHIADLVRPAREATGTRGMLRDSDDDYSGRRLWPLSQAAEVVTAFAVAGAAVAQGEILEVTERGVVRVGAPGLLPGSGYPNSGQPALQWGCRRASSERWPEYVARCAETFLAPVRAMELEVLLGRDGDYRVDLGFVTEDEPALFDVPGFLRAALFTEPGAEAVYGLTRVRVVRNTDDRRVRDAGGLDGSFFDGGPAKSVAAIPPDARYAYVDGAARDIARLPRLARLDHVRLWRPTFKALEALAELPGVRVLELEDARADSLAPLSKLQSLEILYCAGRRSLTEIAALQSLPRLWYLDIRLPGLSDLAPLSELRGLKVLVMVGEKGKVATLAPIAALGDLRRFTLWGIGVADQSLHALTGLSRMMRLEIQASRFKLEEFAEVAAALPEAAGPHRSPWTFSGLMAQLTRCGKCGNSSGYSTLGKPSRSFCFACDARKIEQHVARWEILVSAARTRQGGIA